MDLKPFVELGGEVHGGSLIPAGRMVFGLFTCYQNFVKKSKISLYPTRQRISGFSAKIEILAKFHIRRALRDLIFSKYTHIH